MRLKRYSAANMAEALKIIKHDLGEDAVILSTRKVKGPDGKDGLEITAAVDQSNEKAKPAPKTPSAIDTALEQTNVTQAPGTLSNLAAHLLEHGVAPVIANKISKAVAALEETGFSTEDGLEMVLTKMIKFERPENALPLDKPIVLVGPTGAGKTTTLAKLAVNERMGGRSVGLITLDTYKIGGTQQLGIYADALKEEITIIEGKTTFTDGLKKTQKRDLVFVDTAGINPLEPSRLEDLNQQLQDQHVHVLLVLPSNLNSAELSHLPKAFAALNPQGVIFSKLDETVYLGGLINAAVNSELPVSVATDGQRVPQDLLLLDPASLARRLLSAPKLPWEEIA